MAASGAIILAPAADKITILAGHNPEPVLILNDVNDPELRNFLLQKKSALIRDFGNDDKLFVIISPQYDSNLEQLVDLLDEMTICDIRRYALADYSLATNR